MFGIDVYRQGSPRDFRTDHPGGTLVHFHVDRVTQSLICCDRQTLVRLRAACRGRAEKLGAERGRTGLGSSRGPRERIGGGGGNEWEATGSELNGYAAQHELPPSREATWQGRRHVTFRPSRTSLGNGRANHIFGKVHALSHRSHRESCSLLLPLLRHEKYKYGQRRRRPFRSHVDPRVQSEKGGLAIFPSRLKMTGTMHMMAISDVAAQSCERFSNLDPRSCFLFLAVALD